MTKVIIPFTRGTTFHSHKNHNPDCDILVGHIDGGHDLCYGIYVNDWKDSKGVLHPKGEEFCEYYSGENYTNSKARSYSRMWKPINIPVKYYTLWQVLRSSYESLPK